MMNTPLQDDLMYEILRHDLSKNSLDKGYSVDISDIDIENQKNFLFGKRHTDKDE